jgi:hypothetical protein
MDGGQNPKNLRYKFIQGKLDYLNGDSGTYVLYMVADFWRRPDQLTFP